MPAQFVTVRHRDLEGVGFRSYLPVSAEVIVEPEQVDRHTQIAIVRAGDHHTAQYVADRLSSGLIGAKVHASLDAAQAHVEEWKE